MADLRIAFKYSRKYPPDGYGRCWVKQDWQIVNKPDEYIRVHCILSAFVYIYNSP